MGLTEVGFFVCTEHGRNNFILDVFDARYASERPQKQEPPADTPPDIRKEEKQKDNGEEFLQNIARLMDGYAVSSIDELIRSIDEPSKPKK